MIATARRRAREAGVENAAFVEMEAECLTFPDDSFDAIISRYGSPHFTDAVQALRESYRVLRAGGRFAAAMHGAVAANPYFPAPVLALTTFHSDRKRVVRGKRVSERVDLGGCRLIKQNKIQTKTHLTAK